MVDEPQPGDVGDATRELSENGGGRPSMVELAPRLVAQGPLTIEVGSGREPCVVSVRGELELNSAGALERELHRLLSSVPLVVLDLGGLEFIDSTGLQCLVRVARHSKADGDRLRMLAATHEVDRMLRVTGIREALPMIYREH